MDRWSRDEPQPGSLFQQLREAEKRDHGNEVAENPRWEVHEGRRAYIEGVLNIPMPNMTSWLLGNDGVKHDLKNIPIFLLGL